MKEVWRTICGLINVVISFVLGIAVITAIGGVNLHRAMREKEREMRKERKDQINHHINKYFGYDDEE